MPSVDAPCPLRDGDEVVCISMTTVDHAPSPEASEYPGRT